MAFDEVRFPLRVRFGSEGGVAFRTEVVTCAGGFEVRNRVWAQARRQYDARTGVVGAAEASVLLSFFQARGGRARAFRLKDWSDFSSASDGRGAARFDDQILGTGDGARRDFTLCKFYGDTSRPITKPVAGSVSVGIEGVEVLSGWSVDTTNGKVSFVTPPVSGARVTAGFLFDVPVRFDTDTLDLTAEDRNTALAQIPLIEVRE